MRKRIMKWLPGLLCVALAAGNLTYVSASASDQEGTAVLTGSVSGSDFLQTDVSKNDVDASGADVDISGNDADAAGTDVDASEDDADVSKIDTAVSGDGEPVSKTDSEASLMLLDSDSLWTLDSVEISFSHQ